MAAAQKTRAPPFSFREVEVLTDLMKVHSKDLERDHKSGGQDYMTRKIQADIWVGIVNQVNAVGKCPRTLDQVKEKWRNMKKKAKKEHVTSKFYSNKTGSGERYEISDQSSQIIGLYGDLPSFSGIPGAQDCDSLVNLLTSDVDLLAEENMMGDDGTLFKDLPELDHTTSIPEPSRKDGIHTATPPVLERQASEGYPLASQAQLKYHEITAWIQMRRATFTNPGPCVNNLKARAPLWKIPVSKVATSTDPYSGEKSGFKVATSTEPYRGDKQAKSGFKVATSTEPYRGDKQAKSGFKVASQSTEPYHGDKQSNRPASGSGVATSTEPYRGNKNTKRPAIETEDPASKEKRAKGPEERKSLKDVQMEYYRQAIHLHQVQLECFGKLSKLADVFLKKYDTED